MAGPFGPCRAHRIQQLMSWFMGKLTRKRVALMDLIRPTYHVLCCPMNLWEQFCLPHPSTWSFHHLQGDQLPSTCACHFRALDALSPCPRHLLLDIRVSPQRAAADLQEPHSSSVSTRRPVPRLQATGPGRNKRWKRLTQRPNGSGSFPRVSHGPKSTHGITVEVLSHRIRIRLYSP